MSDVVLNPADAGLEVIDLKDDAGFAQRRLHRRDALTQMEGMKRLASAFVERPESILQELVNAAVELCGADSAGVTIELADRSEARFYKWVATAGQYSGYLNATLPQHPNPCGMCLERGGPQLFRVKQPFFQMMGVEAPTVTDGILFPWRTEGMQGTVWVVAHGRQEAFDGDDLRMMQVLADFAAMGVRQQSQQKQLVARERAAAAATMANELAHQINNPLQSLTNILYLGVVGKNKDASKTLEEHAFADLRRLSALVQRLLSLPKS